MVRALSLILLVLSVSAACAQDLVQPGDTLRVSVAEEPSLDRETKVNAEGRIMLPQLGSIEVVDADLDTIRRRIEQRLADGDIVLKPTVVVEVVAYRPFYVGGTVARPGAIPFEPGLTVRHALLLAGGLDSFPGATRPTTAELLELKAKWRTNAYDLLHVDSRIARLEAELDRTPDADTAGIDRRFVADEDADPILTLDEGLLTDRLDSWSADQQHLRELLGLIDFEIEVLAKQAEHQHNEQELQRAEIDNARKLLDQGLIALPRLQELERQESRMSRDILENEAFAAKARQSQANTKYELSSAETVWRIGVRRELAEAMAERIRLKAETEVLGAALLTAGMSLGGEDQLMTPEPAVIIYRSTHGRSETLHAQMDTEVRPGDVLDVAISEVPNG